MQIAQSGAIVGGGASGLGAATARRLHAHGAHVVIADQSVERGSILADELGERATFVAADVTDPDAVQAAVDVARAHPVPLRIAVSCAGIGGAGRIVGSKGPHSLERFETVIRVNLIGTFNVMRLAAVVIAENEPTDSGERGVCVNTASIAAFDGQIGQIAYSASKGAIVSMTLPAARDLAPIGHPRVRNRARCVRDPSAGESARGRRRSTRHADCNIHPASAARTSSPRSSSTSSRTKCSTAR